MFYSELVKDERLQYGVAPARITRLERTAVARELYKRNRSKTNRSDGEEIDDDENDDNEDNDDITDNEYGDNEDDDEVLEIVSIGEVFTVHHTVNNDDKWLWAESRRSGKVGLLLAERVKVISEYDAHECEPWFHANTARENAISLLAAYGSGAYLVRPSEQFVGDFTLFFNADNIIHRFRIAGHSSGIGDSSDNDYKQKINSDETATDLESYFHFGGRNFSR